MKYERKEMHGWRRKCSLRIGSDESTLWISLVPTHEVRVMMMIIMIIIIIIIILIIIIIIVIIIIM